MVIWLQTLPPILLVLIFALPLAADAGAKKGYSFEDAQKLLKTYCRGCHQGKAPSGGFSLAEVEAAASLNKDAERWNTILARVKNGEMPPKGLPAPAVDQREHFSSWVEGALRAEACASGITPGPAPIRRLNRSEYSSTLRDLLNIHINAGQAMPADGAGGEGFDNAAETLFISPIHAEKYLEAAKSALDYAIRDPKSRRVFFIAGTDNGLTEEQAAQTILASFVHRAFRREVKWEEVKPYMALYHAAKKRNETFDDAVLFALRAVLISPQFLFRIEEPNPGHKPRLVEDYALASRLSYFLWGSMPDDTLFALASKGELRKPAVLKEQVTRMLNDTKSLEFAERFVEQWLGTRELGRDIKPDEKLFPIYYDDEIQAAMDHAYCLFKV